ncbi:hypothetical protein IDSA_00555 [Pseudidiomarina salinarum]|uniref:Uncharacterized protein n=1 Tax=Pseudidiomarina salinarum TaxID=435908 RepID=A0A094JFC8_9GAMM|nr:tetratricopeptide repeat protein [Pseudidiomarina salinarum]KFZ31261.1 hypothetical protein IDSA_00555 [Pseudidiomarina salinarum]RUO70989.1 hypothetical protein CWI79_06000 [Pseudidiomarina salinarum]
MTIRNLVLLGCLLCANPVSAQITSSTSASGKAELSELLRTTKQQLQEGNTDAALSALQQAEDSYAGMARYDYWYGVVALRAGQPTLASLALERAILSDPNHAGARLELAASYLALNRLNKSEAELDYLARFNPPPSAQEAIARYRTEIAERRRRAAEGSQLVMLSVDYGYDSNYLNYPSSFDLFDNTFLEGLAILEADDTQFATGRGVWFHQRDIDARQFVEFSVAGQARVNEDSEARAFDTTILQGSAAYGLRLDAKNSIRYGVDLGQVWLDDGDFRSHIGLLVGWQHNYDLQHTFIANLRARDFSFDARRNDYRGAQLEFEWQYQLRPDLLLRSRYALETERVSNSPARPGGDAMRNYLSVQADYQASGRHHWLGSLNYHSLRYMQEDFAIFNRGVDDHRDDDTLTTRLEWTYLITPQWRTGLSGLYRDQSSTIDFFNLDQTLLQWTVTYVY